MPAFSSLLSAPNRFLRALYDRTLAIAAHRHAEWGLAVVSFAESSFFPIPPDVALIPMCVAKRDRAYRYAAVCTLASVLGGVAGYFIGYFLYDAVGAPIVEFYGLAEKFSSFKDKYEEWGAWIVFGAGLTPIPYKVFTIASGVAAMNLPVFIAASLVGRAARFFLVATLIRKYGAPVQAFIEKRLGLVTIVFLVLLVGGFVLVKHML